MTQNNIKIAITGGIGSGKSTVAKIIKTEGYPVFSCDEIYSELLNDRQFLNMLDSEFCGVIDESGKLDRKKLSGIVFQNKAKLEKLNALTHNKILAAAFDKMAGYKISFLEVPLLFENGFEKLFDNVVVILRNMELRIGSVMQRDNVKRDQVILRINRQFNYDLADFTKYYVIHNDTDLVELRLDVLKLLEEIKSKYIDKNL